MNTANAVGYPICALAMSRLVWRSAPTRVLLWGPVLATLLPAAVHVTLAALATTSHGVTIAATSEPQEADAAVVAAALSPAETAHALDLIWDFMEG